MKIDGKEYRTVTREKMREMDRIAIEEYRIPGIILMENAGRSAAECVLTAYREKGFAGPVLILCGKGNNGGDGFVIARHLHNRGLAVRVLFVGNLADVRPDSDPGVNLEILKKMKTEPGAGRRGGESSPPLSVEEAGDDLSLLRDALTDCELVVDALLGTGLRGEVREPFKSAIEAVNAASKYVVAVDTPSGLDCNEGAPPGCAVRASETVTMGLPKKGFEKSSAAIYLGKLSVGEISLPGEVIR